MKIMFQAGPMLARSFALLAVKMPAVESLVFTKEGVLVGTSGEDPEFVARLQALWRDFTVLVPEPYPQPRVLDMEAPAHNHDHKDGVCDDDCDSGYCMCGPCVDKRTPAASMSPQASAWIAGLLA